MPPKMLALLAQAGLAAIAWWMTKSEQERQLIYAGLWENLEQTAMRIARESSNLAAFAADKKKQTVTV